MTTFAVALMLASVLACSVLCTDGSDSVLPSVVYGEDVGDADRIVFDPGEGTGGFVQYAGNGQTIYLPSEYNGTVARDGCVLLGWSTDPGASEPSYRPGGPYVPSGAKTLYAVWETLGGHGKNSDIEAEVVTVPVGAAASFTKFDGLSKFSVAYYAGSGGTVTYSVTYLTTTDSQTLKNSGSFTEMGFTLVIPSSAKAEDCSLTGTPTQAGIYVIDLHLKGADDYGRSYDYSVGRWYVNSIDTANDPSVLRSINYSSDSSNGNMAGKQIASGPLNTVVRLPDRLSGAAGNGQDGWTVTDGNQVSSVFALGSAYYLKTDATITPHFVSYDTASEVVGVITYNANGGTYEGAFGDTAEINGTKTLDAVKMTAPSGKTFAGWYLSGNDSVLYPVGYLYSIGTNKYTEMVACWVDSSASSHLVEFKNADSSAQNTTFSVIAGKTYALPVNGFAKAGHSLTGWKSGSDTVSVPGTFSVTAAKTYTAVFTENVYTVTVKFNSSGGSGTMADQTASLKYSELSKGITLGSCTFTKSGYTFVGWNTLQGASSANITDKGTLSVSSDGGMVQTITLYAVWQQGYTLTVNFMSNGGDGGNTASVTQYYAYSTSFPQVLTLPANGFTCTGKVFTGWAEKSDGGVKYADKGTYSVTSDLFKSSMSATVTLYAVWSDETITVYIDGTATVLKKGITVGDLPVPSKEGYAFAGWYADEALTQQVPNKLVLNDGAELWTKWTENTPAATVYTFYVFFNGNSQDAVNVPSSVHSVSESSVQTVKIPTQTPTRTGYTFLGWAEKSDAAAAAYKPGSTYSYSFAAGTSVKAVTLYAVWQVSGGSADPSGPDSPSDPSNPSKKYTVVFKNGTATIKTLTTSGKVDKPADPTAKDGYAFLEWRSGSKAFDFDMPVTADTVITAAFVQVFHLEIKEKKVSIVIDSTSINGSPVKRVAYTYPGEKEVVCKLSEIKDFDASKTAKGTVKVSVTTSDGTYSASSLYDINATEDSIKIYVDGTAQIVKKGTTVANLEKPSKNGYVFEGWYSDESLETELADGTVLEEDMKVWSKLTEKSGQTALYLSLAIMIVGAALAAAGARYGVIAALVGCVIVCIGGYGLMGVA